MRSWIAVVLAAGCRLGFDTPASTTDGGPGGDAGNATPRDLQITVTGRGAVAGAFGVCSSDCTYSVTGDVVVDTYAADTWSLTPSAACTGTTCSVPADVDRVDFTFAQMPPAANIVFVSSTAVSLTSGIGALDAHCQTLASAAGLSGTFIAFASTTAVDARDRLAGSRGWMRPDGMPIFDLPADLGDASLARAITMDETGTQFALLPTLVATGSEQDGTVATGNNCDDWSTTSQQQMAGGQGLASGSWMLGGWVSQCQSVNRIMCMQTGRNVAVQVTTTTFAVGRRLFTSSARLPVGAGGVAAGDELCQSEAQAAGLTGTYRAVLATTTERAVDRLGSLAGPWRRSDDVLVTLGDLDAPRFDAAITVDAAGVKHTPPLAFGADTLRELASVASSCSDWTDASASLSVSSSMLADPFVAGRFGGSCNSVRVACAEVP